MPPHTPPTPSPQTGFGLGLTFDRDGLVTVVVQDHLTGEVRMVAHANLEAVSATLSTGRATFWSRSRKELWEKGKTSGNGIAVSRVLVDCDADCLLYMSEPAGPSCHTGAPSCFFRALPASDDAANASAIEAPPQTLLARLEHELEARKASTGKKSYTKSLYDGGPPKIGEKLVEEAGELARAVAAETDERVTAEAADVLFHVMVALRSRGIGFDHVLRELDRRTGTSGHDEKRSREPAG